jgi:hypothetical protein
MKLWASYRSTVWKIDRWWSAHTLIARMEILKGNGAWEPLVKAPHQIELIDEIVADLADCVVASPVTSAINSWGDQWSPIKFDLYDDDWGYPYLDEDRRWEGKYKADRAREADLLLVHYLLPHVRLYRKLRALELSERAYYYRLNSALKSLGETYNQRSRPSGNVQS